MPVPVFTVGEVLTAANMNKVGLWLVKTQTIGNAVSSVTVNSAFSADFDDYLITVSGGAGSGNGALQMRVGSTTTNYFNSLIYTSWTNALATPVGNKNGTFWTYAGNSTPSGIRAEIFVNSPFLSKITTIRASWINENDTGLFTGMLNNTTSYTDFSFTPNSGTLTGGTIRVYGYRN